MASSAQTTDDPTPPKAIAERYIDTFVSSLHQQLAPLVTTIAKDHLLLLSKRDHKQRVI
jgi:hypothetical protein